MGMRLIPQDKAGRYRACWGHCLACPGREELNMITSVATKSLCAAPPSLVLRLPLGGRWLIYSGRNELPHRSCRKQGKQAEERVKIIPAQIFTLIVSWAAIPTIKQSIALYTDCGHMVGSYKYKLSPLIATPSDGSLQKERAKPKGPIQSCQYQNVYFPHLTTHGNRFVYWCCRPYTFSCSERVWIITEICCILPLDCWGWGNMGHGGWHLHTLSLQLSLISGH